MTGEQLNIELFLILTVRLGLSQRSQPLNEAAVFVLILTPVVFMHSFLTPAVVGNP